MLVDLAVALALLGCSSMALLIWCAWHLNEMVGKPPSVLVAVAFITLLLGGLFVGIATQAAHKAPACAAWKVPAPTAEASP
jgi:hypothetical protein